MKNQHISHNNPDSKDIVRSKNTEIKSLVLHNDEHNLFDFVIDALISVCKHTETQAEQCALITHNNGKCDVKDGVFNDLKALKDELIYKGLQATIE